MLEYGSNKESDMDTHNYLTVYYTQMMCKGIPEEEYQLWGGLQDVIVNRLIHWSKDDQSHSYDK